MTHIHGLLGACLALALGACGEDERATTRRDTAATTDTAEPDTTAPDTTTPDTTQPDTATTDTTAPDTTTPDTTEPDTTEPTDTTQPDTAPETAEDVPEDVTGPSCVNDALAPGAAGLWYAELAAFTAAVGDTQLVDFERRGDGVTAVPVGTDVPVDEYVACCGVRLSVTSADPSARLVWAGNAVTGFSVRAMCPGDRGLCQGKSGVRVEPVAPVGAIAAVYAGDIEATVYDTAGGELATYALPGFGVNFVGYASEVPIGAAIFVDFAGEDLGELRLRRCD